MKWQDGPKDFKRWRKIWPKGHTCPHSSSQESSCNPSPLWVPCSPHTPHSPRKEKPLIIVLLRVMGGTDQATSMGGGSLCLWRRQTLFLQLHSFLNSATPGPLQELSGQVKKQTAHSWASTSLSHWYGSVWSPRLDPEEWAPERGRVGRTGDRESLLSLQPENPPHYITVQNPVLPTLLNFTPHSGTIPYLHFYLRNPKGQRREGQTGQCAHDPNTPWHPSALLTSSSCWNWAAHRSSACYLYIFKIESTFKTRRSHTKFWISTSF